MLYEHRKHDGSSADSRRQHLPELDTLARCLRKVWLPRGSEDEKQGQLSPRLPLPARRHEVEARAALEELKAVAIEGGNVFFDPPMRAALVRSLQQVTEAFFEVGGQYRQPST